MRTVPKRILGYATISDTSFASLLVEHIAEKFQGQESSTLLASQPRLYHTVTTFCALGPTWQWLTGEPTGEPVVLHSISAPGEAHEWLIAVDQLGLKCLVLITKRPLTWAAFQGCLGQDM